MTFGLDQQKAQLVDDLAAPGWMSDAMQDRVNDIAGGCADLADIIKAKSKCKVMHVISDKHISMHGTPRRDIHPNHTRPAVITVERGTRSNKTTPRKTCGSLAAEARVVL